MFVYTSIAKMRAYFVNTSIYSKLAVGGAVYANVAPHDAL